MSASIAPSPAFKLRPYQIDAIAGARRAFMPNKETGEPGARAVIVTMPTGCHAKGQPIMMASGRRILVEDVQVGDLLMGPDLRPRQVLALHRGRQEMAIIRPVRRGLLPVGEPWRVNMGHMLTLATSEPGPSNMSENWIDISVRDYLALPSRPWPLHLIRIHARGDSFDPLTGAFVPTTPGVLPRHPRLSTHAFIVELAGADDYFGFEIDGDHRYLLDDGTVTHNSGKSVVFKAIAQGVAERGRRVLLLVEGIKLVHQAAAHLRAAGLSVGIEMAEHTAVVEADLSKPQRELFDALPDDGEGLFVKGAQVLSANILCDRGLARKLRNAQGSAGGWYLRCRPELPQIVVASVDSMINRLDRYASDTFRMVITDECHHAAAASYLAVFKHFGISVPLNEPKDIADLRKSPWQGDVLLFGLTATPDRGDKRDLMRLFDAVGYEYDIQTAIADGWLVPIQQKFCWLDGLDLSKVRKSAGDLDARQLCELLEPLMVPICTSVIAESAGRPTLCYSPLCNLAESVTQRLRMMAPDQQVHTITGETEDDQREQWFQGIDRGEVWALSSVGTLTEGVDLPRAAVAAMLRLTMSRLLYAQILGRVLRPAPEIANALNDLATPEERRALIAASSKPHATILDFAGNCGKHTLVRAIDILTSEDDPALKMAEKLMEKGEIDPLEALARAREELAKMLARARGKDIERILVSPFDLLDVPHKKDEWARPATDRQIASLLESGVIDFRKTFPKFKHDPARHEAAVQEARAEATAKLRKMFDMTSASAVLAERSRRIDAGQCSPKQLRMLIKAGIPAGSARAMPFDRASAALDQLAQQGWAASPAWIERWSSARREAA